MSLFCCSCNAQISQKHITMISVLGTSSSILLRARLPLRLNSLNNLWSSSSSVARCSSSSSSHHHQPPDVAQLAQTARITLSPQEVEDFAPKIRQVVDWFGQLQAVDLESIEPSLRADTEVSSTPREDIPETFGNRDAMLAEIPSFAEPYIKVPKVLNKE